MRSKEFLVNECYKAFVKAHPELSIPQVNNIAALLQQEKVNYVRITVVHSIEYMLDELARTGVKIDDR